MIDSSFPVLIAFSAGLISFLSPCVLPLIPGYLSFISGTSLSQASSHRLQIFSNSLAFVFGFSLVFAVLGVLLNTLLEALAYDVLVWLSRIGGIIIIFFGLFLTGLIKIPFLQFEHKINVQPNFKSRLLSSFIFGAAFAAGWTPCVGAVLGSILGLAATNPTNAFLLLLIYSLGFGIPFLIVGAFTSTASTLITKNLEKFRYLNLIFGILLIIIGVLIFSQNLARFFNSALLD